MISKNLGELLKARRGDFNRRYQVARHIYPDLDGVAFLNFLEKRIDPLMQAVDGRGQPSAVFDTAYDLALELHGKKFLGANSHNRWIDEGWARLFPAISALIAVAPVQILGSLTNALHVLAATPGSRPAEWIDSMVALGARCPDPATLLKLGQVLAWRSGLAHFREGALQLADTLPPELVLKALGVAESRPWPEIRDRLLSDPWFNPATPTDSPAFRVVGQAGTFRGLGGLFMEPPLVRANSSHFIVKSAEACWILTADVFGATFHRGTAEEFASGSTTGPDLEAKGSQVRWKENWYEIPFGNGISSCGATATTVALTSEMSHSVLLLALT